MVNNNKNKGDNYDFGLITRVDFEVGLDSGGI